jgi:beta-lactamase superfamily II metal-dependent hydrolase
MAATDVDGGLLQDPGGFIEACKPTDLVYFTLNVGDGDTQLLLLPADKKGRRQCMVVDCIRANKLFALIEALAEAELLQEVAPLIELVVATHPHDDHISGMPALLRRFGSEHVHELWEPGYYHPSAAYLGMMRELEDIDAHHLQPASGTTRFLGLVKLTVLAPGIVLRNQFDSYGVNINNASIALKIDFPAARTYERNKDRSYVRLPSTQTLILGADAQTRSWSQVLVDFPQLGPANTAVTKAVRGAHGYEPLSAQVFKVPHHGSKHGLNLELVEDVRPAVSIVSSVHDGGRYGFPHAVTQAALREALDPISSKEPGTVHRPDVDLQILYTGSTMEKAGKGDPSRPLGTVGMLVGVGGRREIWRFCDAPGDNIDLDKGRRMRPAGTPVAAGARV